MTRARNHQRDSAPSPEPTDDVPRWRTTRVVAVKNTFPVEAGYIFTGDPAAMGFPYGSYEACNEAAKRWESGYIRAPESPKWVATKRTEVNNRVVEAGTAFGSYSWPDDDDWFALNKPAKDVAAYYEKHRGNARLPRLAWQDDALNTIEAEAARNYRPPPTRRRRGPCPGRFRRVLVASRGRRARRRSPQASRQAARRRA